MPDKNEYLSTTKGPDFNVNVEIDDGWTAFKSMNEEEQQITFARLLYISQRVEELVLKNKEQELDAHAVKGMLTALVATECNGRATIRMAEFMVPRKLKRVPAVDGSFIELSTEPEDG